MIIYSYQTQLLNQRMLAVTRNAGEMADAADQAIKDRSAEWNIDINVTGRIPNFPGSGSASLAGAEATFNLGNNNVVGAQATGGPLQNGVTLVGEQGPELINFNQGGYVHNAGQTASMLGGSDELISEIRRLNTKVEQLEAAAISTAVSNTKLLKLFQRVTPDGNTIAISGTVTTTP